MQEGLQSMAGEMSAEEATKTTEAPAVMTVAGEEGKISFGKATTLTMVMCAMHVCCWFTIILKFSFSLNIFVLVQ